MAKTTRFKFETKMIGDTLLEKRLACSSFQTRTLILDDYTTPQITTFIIFISIQWCFRTREALSGAHTSANAVPLIQSSRTRSHTLIEVSSLNVAVFFHQEPFCYFHVIFLTNKQTNKQGWKHNLKNTSHLVHLCIQTTVWLTLKGKVTANCGLGFRIETHKWYDHIITVNNKKSDFRLWSESN